jgi:hypothetical protein
LREHGREQVDPREVVGEYGCGAGRLDKMLERPAVRSSRGPI